MIFRHARFVILVCASLTLVACSSQTSANTRDPLASLQAIPSADSAKYDHVRDMKTWQNPYLIVRPDGIALLDVADSAEIILKPNELLPALAKLPPSNWPYGRVVAAAENEAKSSAQDQIAVRRNKGIVGGLLTGAHIAVRWVPSA
ncbi:MAG TPA: hypothetical protein VJQ59_02750 [Candidatus Sulfotelmatobacter sp.]|nr:hypothetical protein [Candidatus Sulfotelmatobacter sp.]